MVTKTKTTKPAAKKAAAKKPTTANTPTTAKPAPDPSPAPAPVQVKGYAGAIIDPRTHRHVLPGENVDGPDAPALPAPVPAGALE